MDVIILQLIIEMRSSNENNSKKRKRNQKKTWWDCVKNDMESLGLSQNNAQSRNIQRRRIKGVTG